MWTYGFKMESELYHFGKKGMRWGVRRYQNKDGSLTPAGERRYNRDLRDNPLTKEEKKNGGRSANASKYVKEDMERTKDLVDSSGNLVRNIKTATNLKLSSQNKPKLDLSNMSDKEMRDAVNRAFLERQYNDMFNAPEVSKGRERANDVLDVAGSVLAIGSSALGIALAIKKLKG